MSDYPNEPGSKGGHGTSEAAADAIAPLASGYRREALDAVRALGGCTVLEACDLKGRERWTLQPRFSELKDMGLIEPSGDRRRNPSGQSAVVWRLTDAGWEAVL